LQIFLMIQIKRFVTAKAVHDVRIAYDAFETHMYAGHTITTANGYNRGVNGYFDPKLFHSLDSDVQSTACRISLSHPKFLVVILTIWTLSCVGEIKESYKAAVQMIFHTKTVNSMAYSLEHQDEGAHSLTLVGLTYCMKAIVACLALVRFAICGVLLWMGCRWLVATTNFGDLILNAVALVFILELKDFLYNILVPSRNKRDLQNTSIAPPEGGESPSFIRFMGSFFWIPVTIIWVFAYIYMFQQVLPGYKWDVGAVCTQWTIERYSLTKIVKSDL